GCLDEGKLIHCPLNRARWEAVASSDEEIAFEPACYDNAKEHMMELYNNTVKGLTSNKYRGGGGGGDGHWGRQRQTVVSVMFIVESETERLVYRHVIRVAPTVFITNMSVIGQQQQQQQQQQLPHGVMMKLPSIGIIIIIIIIIMGVVLTLFGTWIFLQVYWSCSGGAAALMTLGTSILGYPIIPGLGDDAMAAVVTGGNLTDSMSGRPSFIEYISPPPAGAGAGAGAGDGVEWSRIQCVGWHRNRSCAFDNIYYDKTDDTFYILLPSNPLLRGNIMRAPYDGKALQYHNSPITYHEDTGIPVTEDTIRELTNGCQRGITFRRFQPEIIFADGEEGFVSWRATITKGDISALDGISVYFSLMWTWNVGHFMYDSMYPIWVTILRFGYGKDTINLLGYESYDSKSDDVNFPHWDLMRAFSHGGVSGLTSVVLDTNVTRMSRLLVGSRWMNHRHQLRHMGMPGSYSYENA
ncbi:hypothetical protein FOL46_002020, partial [Perkinsus olseni]